MFGRNTKAPKTPEEVLVTALSIECRIVSVFSELFMITVMARASTTISTTIRAAPATSQPLGDPCNAVVNRARAQRHRDEDADGKDEQEDPAAPYSSPDS